MVRIFARVLADEERMLLSTAGRNAIKFFSARVNYCQTRIAPSARSDDIRISNRAAPDDSRGDRCGTAGFQRNEALTLGSKPKECVLQGALSNETRRSARMRSSNSTDR